MRVRVRFAKAGKLRFISAIDLGRVWERALRKADLPIAYSEGYSPHPKVSFGDALPLGYASQAEFAELTFSGPMDLDVMRERLNAAFPQGLAVLDAAEFGDGDRRLGKLLQASMWGLDYPAAAGLAAAVAALPAEGALLVQRERKGEVITTDLRPPLVGVVADGRQVRAILHHPGFVPGVVEGGLAPRAEDVHTALAATSPGMPTRPALITRLAQGCVTTTTPGVDDALRGTTEALVPGRDHTPHVADPAATPQPPAAHSQEHTR